MKRLLMVSQPHHLLLAAFPFGKRVRAAPTGLSWEKEEEEESTGRKWGRPEEEGSQAHGSSLLSAANVLGMELKPIPPSDLIILPKGQIFLSSHENIRKVKF